MGKEWPNIHQLRIASHSQGYAFSSMVDGHCLSPMSHRGLGRFMGPTSEPWPRGLHQVTASLCSPHPQVPMWPSRHRFRRSPLFGKPAKGGTVSYTHAPYRVKHLMISENPQQAARTRNCGRGHFGNLRMFEAPGNAIEELFSISEAVDVHVASRGVEVD